MATVVANRTALGICPPEDYLEVLQDAFTKVAPKGLSRVSPMMCGTCSVEGAIKTACAIFMAKKRGDRVDFNELELSSCMSN